MAVVQFESVEFRYGSAPPILRRLDLSIAAAQTVALVGRSGAGKTSMLKLINRLQLPSSGRVLVEGRDTREWDGIKLRRRIGYVFQDIGLFPHMTVEENVTVVPRLEAWPAARAAARGRNILRGGEGRRKVQASCGESSCSRAFSPPRW